MHFKVESALLFFVPNYQNLFLEIRAPQLLIAMNGMQIPAATPDLQLLNLGYQ